MVESIEFELSECYLPDYWAENIIYPLIGVNGLGKMAHWIDYIRDQVF